MSTILFFAPRPRAVQAQALPNEPAQILFFTGVRYERPGELASVEVPPRRRGRPARTPARAKSAGQPV